VRHNRWHPGLAPAFEVGDGKELTHECDEGLGGQFTRESRMRMSEGSTWGSGIL